MNQPTPSSQPRPAVWSLVLAFTLVYLSWGTTYLAIKRGVKDEKLPPALFVGVRLPATPLSPVERLPPDGCRLPDAHWRRQSRSSGSPARRNPATDAGQVHPRRGLRVLLFADRQFSRGFRGVQLAARPR